MEPCLGDESACSEIVESSSRFKCYYRIKKYFNYNRFPTFRQPAEIGCFSLDGQRRFHLDRHQLKYLVLPSNSSNQQFDLNKGYEKECIEVDSNSEKIDNILRWILANKSKVETVFGPGDPSENKRFLVDFVLYRHELTTLMCEVYLNQNDWIICATKFQGTIYLCEFHTKRRTGIYQTRTERQALCSFWNRKFLQYVTSDTQNGMNNVEKPVNKREEFCIVLEGRLGEHSLLYATQILSTEGPETGSTGTKQYVELKSLRKMVTKKQKQNFLRFKLLKWWAGAYLAGISKTVCGFRDDDGIVQNITTYHTEEFLQMTEGLWSPSVLLDFCDEFLQFVRLMAVKDDPNIVYKFSWQPNEDIECEELSPAGEYQVLPEWYIHPPSGSDADGSDVNA